MLRLIVIEVSGKQSFVEIMLCVLINMHCEEKCVCFYFKQYQEIISLLRALAAG